MSTVAPADEMERPLLMSIREAADLLGTSYWTVYRMVEDGKLPHRRLRRSIRIPREAVLELAVCEPS